MTLPVYRGDIVNAPEFSADARTPDPRRMIKAHARSAMTMNFVRALIDGGFADLHHPEYWDLGWVGHSPLADEYLTSLDRYAEEAATAGPGFVEIQNTMLFAAVGQKPE